MTDSVDNEDSEPEEDASVPVIEEHEIPVPDLKSVIKLVEARERTRRQIAIGLLFLVALMALGGEAALIFGKVSAEGLRDDLSILFTPIVALASVAFGFFFGRGGS